MDTRTGIKLGKAFLFRFHRRVNSKGVNGNCVTVVASTGLHFRVFHFLTSAASHDLKKTVYSGSGECGMLLGKVRESESPLKERSERV